VQSQLTLQLLHTSIVEHSRGTLSISSSMSSSSSIALNKPDILKQILDYVGPGHWLFTIVNSQWVQLYYGVASMEVTGHIAEGRDIKVTCIPQMTLYSSAFASPSRLRLADKQCTIKRSGAAAQRYQYALGRYADIVTLSAAHFSGTVLDAWTLYGVIAADAVPKLQWLCALMMCDPSTELSFDAASSSSFAVLTWLKEQGVKFTTETAVSAARTNQVAVLQYLLAQECPLGAEVCREAAASGSLEALRWAREEECPWEANEIMIAAASSGSVELTAWVLQQPGVPVYPGVLSAAAKRGHTAVCAYLRQQQCPADASACMYAVKGGHLDTLRCLLEHGCTWNEGQVRRRAAERGSIAMLEYIQQEGILATAAQLTDMLNIAGAADKLAAAQWLRERGAEWPQMLKHKAKYWRGRSLAWARQQGCAALVGNELLQIFD
jgi:hypothetical protein